MLPGRRRQSLLFASRVWPAGATLRLAGVPSICRCFILAGWELQP